MTLTRRGRHARRYTFRLTLRSQGRHAATPACQCAQCSPATEAKARQYAVSVPRRIPRADARSTKES